MQEKINSPGLNSLQIYLEANRIDVKKAGNMEENINTDKKSLKFLKGRNTDWDELAKDCVSFANAQGGSIYIGIENKDSLPPANQKISDRSLVEFELIIKTGKGKGTQYAVNPEFIRKINFKGKTNLKNIEDYRLEELIYKDLKAYSNSGFSDIHGRIGLEINQFKVKRMLKSMVEKNVLESSGSTRGMKYQLKQSL